MQHPTLPNAFRIMQILKTNWRGYSALRDYHFKRWCAYQSEQHFLPLKDLLQCDYILNWYETEWNDLVQNRLCRELKSVLGYMTETDMQYNLDSYAGELEDRYPSALFKELKR
ncbi:MAG: hypothetical protein Q4G08_04070 [Capnocytophaga sp.]|nr:hypothetical protein [Capnocytophaga sp.]